MREGDWVADAARLREALLAAAGGRGIAITGHDTPDADALISCALLRELCAWWGVPARVALPTQPEERARLALARLGVDVDAWRGEIGTRDAVALVDDHQTPRAGTLAACVDHHEAARPPECAFALIEPAGACALLLLALMRGAGMPFSERREAMAVTALYLDTLALRSTKLSREEADWARERAKALALDVNWLEREGLWLTDLSRPAAQAAQNGLKAYAFSGKRVLSSYVQTGEMTPERLQPLLDYIQRETRARGLALWVFLVRDPIAGETWEYDVSPDGVTRRRFGALISRGKDVMPRVERALLKEGLGDGGAARRADGGAFGSGRGAGRARP